MEQTLTPEEFDKQFVNAETTLQRNVPETWWR